MKIYICPKCKKQMFCEIRPTGYKWICECGYVKFEEYKK